MKEIFSLYRFLLLLKKTLLERPMQMFGFTALLLTLVLILYGIVKSFIGFNAAQNLSFIWGLPCGSFFLASFVFGHFSSNASGSSFLTLPASNFEKWFCGILIAGVIYPVIFIVFYHVIDLAFVTAYHNSLDVSSPFYKQQYDNVYTFNINGILAWKVYSMFFFLTGAMLLGSLYFNKIAFIKTGIVLCTLVLLVVGLNWLIAILIFGKINNATPFGHVNIPVGRGEGIIELPSHVVNIFNYSIWYAFPTVLWLLSFVRFREKEF